MGNLLAKRGLVIGLLLLSAATVLLTVIYLQAGSNPPRPVSQEQVVARALEMARAASLEGEPSVHGAVLTKFWKYDVWESGEITEQQEREQQDVWVVVIKSHGQWLFGGIAPPPPGAPPQPLPTYQYLIVIFNAHDGQIMAMTGYQDTRPPDMFVFQ